jgi:hypothetical protein
MMTTPYVITSGANSDQGLSYNMTDLVRWIEVNRTSPMSNQPLVKADIKLNLNLRDTIDAYRKANPQVVQDYEQAWSNFAPIFHHENHMIMIKKPLLALHQLPYLRFALMVDSQSLHTTGAPQEGRDSLRVKIVFDLKSLLESNQYQDVHIDHEGSPFHRLGLKISSESRFIQELLETCLRQDQVIEYLKQDPKKAFDEMIQEPLMTTTTTNLSFVERLVHSMPSSVQREVAKYLTVPDNANQFISRHHAADAKRKALTFLLDLQDAQLIKTLKVCFPHCIFLKDELKRMFPSLMDWFRNTDGTVREEELTEHGHNKARLLSYCFFVVNTINPTVLKVLTSLQDFANSSIMRSLIDEDLRTTGQFKEPLVQFAVEKKHMILLNALFGFTSWKDLALDRAFTNNDMELNLTNVYSLMLFSVFEFQSPSAFLNHFGVRGHATTADALLKMKLVNVACKAQEAGSPHASWLLPLTSKENVLKVFSMLVPRKIEKFKDGDRKCDVVWIFLVGFRDWIHDYTKTILTTKSINQRETVVDFIEASKGIKDELTQRLLTQAFHQVSFDITMSEELKAMLFYSLLTVINKIHNLCALADLDTTNPCFKPLLSSIESDEDIKDMVQDYWIQGFQKMSLNDLDRVRNHIKPALEHNELNKLTIEDYKLIHSLNVQEVSRDHYPTNRCYDILKLYLWSKLVVADPLDLTQSHLYTYMDIAESLLQGQPARQSKKVKLR